LKLRSDAINKTKWENEAEKDAAIDRAKQIHDNAMRLFAEDIVKKFSTEYDGNPEDFKKWIEDKLKTAGIVEGSEGYELIINAVVEVEKEVDKFDLSGEVDRYTGYANQIGGILSDLNQNEIKLLQEKYADRREVLEKGQAKELEILEKAIETANGIIEEQQELEIEREENEMDLLAEQMETELSNKFLTEEQKLQIENDYRKKRELAEKAQELAKKKRQDALDAAKIANDAKMLALEKKQSDAKQALQDKEDKAIVKRKRKQQAMDIKSAVINTAAGMMKAFNDPSLPFPLNWIQSALIAAQGAAQIAIIKSQKFAKGGKARGKSHSQGGITASTPTGLIEYEGGEWILNKERSDKYDRMLAFINSGNKNDVDKLYNLYSNLKTPQFSIPAPSFRYETGGKASGVNIFDDSAIIEIQSLRNEVVSLKQVLINKDTNVYIDNVIDNQELYTMVEDGRKKLMQRQL